MWMTDKFYFHVYCSLFIDHNHWKSIWAGISTRSSLFSFSHIHLHHPSSQMSIIIRYCQNVYVNIGRILLLNFNIVIVISKIWLFIDLLLSRQASTTTKRSTRACARRTQRWPTTKNQSLILEILRLNLSGYNYPIWSKSLLSPIYGKINIDTLILEILRLNLSGSLYKQEAALPAGPPRPVDQPVAQRVAPEETCESTFCTKHSHSF